MKEASCPLPTQEAAFKDGQEFLPSPSEGSVSGRHSRVSDVHTDRGAPGALKTAGLSGSRVLQPGPRGGSLSRCSPQPQRPPASGQGEPGASCRARRTIPDTPGSRCQPAGMRVQSSPRGTARASLDRNQDPVTQCAAPRPRLQ